MPVRGAHWPSIICKSVLHSPAPPILTITSRGPSTWGSSISSTFSGSVPMCSSYSYSRAAFTRLPPRDWGFRNGWPEAPGTSRRFLRCLLGLSGRTRVFHNRVFGDLVALGVYHQRRLRRHVQPELLPAAQVLLLRLVNGYLPEPHLRQLLWGYSLLPTQIMVNKVM